MTDFNPLQLKCTACGAQVEDFDIVRQKYKCHSCECEISAHEVKSRYQEWLKEHAEETAKTVGHHTEKALACPSCGAEVSFKTDIKGELIQTTCEYCGAHFVASPPGEKFVSPDMIIPFFITLEEAKDRLIEWCEQNKSCREAKLVLQHIHELKGYYLPYEVVKGPIRFQVTRDRGTGTFICGGYLKGTAVSVNSDQHNLTLDAMEPFDWSATRAYDIGYIAGQNVKLQDIYDKKELNKRVFEEIEYAYRPALEKELQTTGFSANVANESPFWIRGTALLPTYLLNISIGRKTFHVAVNGQTGRVAVERIKKRETGKNAWIMPSLIFIAICICWCFPMYSFLGADGIFILFLFFPFHVMFYKGFIRAGNSERRRLLQFIMQGDAVTTKRNGSRLQILPSDLPPATATPVVFETINDISTPVKIVSIYNWKQIVITTLYSLLIVFHPWIYAILYALLLNVPFDNLHWFNNSTMFYIGVMIDVAWIYSQSYLNNPLMSYIAKDGREIKIKYKDINRHKTGAVKKVCISALLLLIVGWLAFSFGINSIFDSEEQIAKDLYKKGMRFYSYGKTGIINDDNEHTAYINIKESAEKGNIDAQYQLGIFYENGVGVDTSMNEALKWYKIAAENGNYDAQYNLGIMYDDGRGVVENDTLAFKYYLLAAERWHRDANYKVGVCYEYGVGTDKNISEALKWYQRAAEQGHQEAKEKLEK